MKGEIDHVTIIVGNVHTYPIILRTRQKIIKDTEDLNNVITQFNPEHSTQQLRYILFKCIWTVLKDILSTGHETNVNTFKRTEIKACFLTTTELNYKTTENKI